MNHHHDDNEPSRIEMSEGELEKLILEIKASSLSAKSKEVMISVLLSFLWLNRQLESKRLSIKKLLRLFFGSKSEKPKPSDKNPDKTPPEQKPKSEKKKGHGKNGQAQFATAEKIAVPHPSLKLGDQCPSCLTGRLYQFGFTQLLRIFGQAPLTAKTYSQEQLRCALCQEVFTAPLPAEAGEERNHATAKAMVSVLNYGAGMPFYRLEALQRQLGVPVADATQFDMCEDVANAASPIAEYLKKASANGPKFGIDDTPNRILSIMAENKTRAEGERRSVQTTAIVAECDGHRVALFATGRKHAGENIDSILNDRDQVLPMPMTISDASPSNFAHGFSDLLIKVLCMDHGRRNFYDLLEEFPESCRHVVSELGKVYHNDALTKALSSSERLAYHQQHSQEIMNGLNTWMEEKIENREVEPNSNLGKAIAYFLNHWNGLTQFLRIEGAPLSNIEVEQLIKRCILRRKNSQKYKTQVGAWIGDLLMSLIETCRYNKINAFDYLVEIQTYASRVRLNPADWLPWTYQQTIAAMHAQHT